MIFMVCFLEFFEIVVIFFVLSSVWECDMDMFVFGEWFVIMFFYSFLILVCDVIEL